MATSCGADGAQDRAATSPRETTIEAAATLSRAASRTIRVRSDRQLDAAVSKLANTGGTIRLLPNFYRTLVVRPRSARPLRIMGTTGVRIERVVFDRTRNVSLGGARISPRTRHALVELLDSKHVELHDLVVTAEGTKLSASVAVHRSRYIEIRSSTFTHCGDRSPNWSNCLLPLFLLSTAYTTGKARLVPRAFMASAT